MIVGFILFIEFLLTLFVMQFPPSEKEIASFQSRLEKELREKDYGIFNN